MTSAPNCASVNPASGAATKADSSTIRRPERIPFVDAAVARPPRGSFCMADCAAGPCICESARGRGRYFHLPVPISMTSNEDVKEFYLCNCASQHRCAIKNYKSFGGESGESDWRERPMSRAPVHKANSGTHEQWRRTISTLTHRREPLTFLAIVSYHLARRFPSGTNRERGEASDCRSRGCPRNCERRVLRHQCHWDFGSREGGGG